jgi:hypothetical protein
LLKSCAWKKSNIFGYGLLSGKTWTNQSETIASSKNNARRKRSPKYKNFYKKLISYKDFGPSTGLFERNLIPK